MPRKMPVVQATLADVISNTKLREVLENADRVAALHRAIVTTRDVAKRGTHGMEDDKLGARLAVMDVSAKLIVRDMTESLTHMLWGLLEISVEMEVPADEDFLP
jgi:hypothetical protein